MAYPLARGKRRLASICISVFLFTNESYSWQGNDVTVGQDPTAAAASPDGALPYTPVDDYVPCLFTSEQRRRLRLMPPTRAAKPKLDKTAATNTIDQVVDAVKAQSATSDADKKYLQDFSANLRQMLPTEAIEGQTPAQAYTTVVQAITEAQDTTPVPQPATSSTQDKKKKPAATGSSIAPKAEAAALKTAENKLKPETYEPPTDVSCSMSLMSWQETSDIFGRRIANQYVGIQVTIRNLNRKNEFLVHDIEVAVDTGISEQHFGRFQAGRDKLLVRAVAQRGQSEDRRNLALHSLEVIGAIAGSSSIAGSKEFEDAVAVFQGAFIPGFSTIFPDHTVEQVNHINDMAFSASSTSKVIVPIQGSVPLVTFIAEKPLEQLPFAWCGHVGSGGIRFMPGKNKQQSCETETSYPVSPWKASDEASVKGWDNLHYKNWQGAALRILEQNTFAVVGGVHIQQVPTATAHVSNLDCPTLPSGPVDISQTTDGFVSCTVSGTNFDQVASVTLKKGTQTIAGKIKPGKEGTSAAVQFDPAALSDGDGTYELFLVATGGKETDSGDQLRLSVQPYIKPPDNGTFTVSNNTLTLQGKHLDKLTKVSLAVSGASTIDGTLGAAAANATTRTVTFTGLDAKAQYYLEYRFADVLNPIALKTVKVSVSNAAGAAAPGAPH